MFGSSKNGLALLEIVVAILIIGIMATFVMPRFATRGTREIDSWARNISALHQLAYERALLTNKVHKLYFSLSKDAVRTIVVQQATDTTNSLGESTFVDVTAEYLTTRYEWPEQLRVLNFYIKGIDEARGGTMKDGWYFITPQGTSQPVIMTVQDEGTQAIRSLVVNPFTGGIAIYATAQHP